MPAIDFPNSPTNGQTVVVGTSTYTWNATATTWDLTTTTVVGPTGPTGPTGPSGVISVTGPINNTGTSTSATLGIAGGTAGQVLTSNGTSQASFQTFVPTVHPFFLL